MISCGITVTTAWVAELTRPRGTSREFDAIFMSTSFMCRIRAAPQGSLRAHLYSNYIRDISCGASRLAQWRLGFQSRSASRDCASGEAQLDGKIMQRDCVPFCGEGDRRSTGVRCGDMGRNRRCAAMNEGAVPNGAAPIKGYSYPRSGLLNSCGIIVRMA